MTHPGPTGERPVSLGPLPSSSAMIIRDTGLARVALAPLFARVCDVEAWPAQLSHYRSVRMLNRDSAGGGVVEMAADRPFGDWRWPTSWTSLMAVDAERATIRFRHIGGLTTGMEVEWSFVARAAGPNGEATTAITLLHLWDGWDVPLVGAAVAIAIIGPVFVHGIAERTIAGLVAAAERAA